MSWIRILAWMRIRNSESSKLDPDPQDWLLQRCSLSLMVYEVQCSLRGIEEETDRREGKGRHYCSGDVLECRTRNLQQG